jgi:hypothetical protein
MAGLVLQGPAVVVDAVAAGVDEGELVRCAVAVGWPHTHYVHVVEKLRGKHDPCYLLSNSP